MPRRQDDEFDRAFHGLRRDDVEVSLDGLLDNSSGGGMSASSDRSGDEPPEDPPQDPRPYGPPDEDDERTQRTGMRPEGTRMHRMEETFETTRQGPRGNMNQDLLRARLEDERRANEAQEAQNIEAERQAREFLEQRAAMRERQLANDRIPRGSFDDRAESPRISKVRSNVHQHRKAYTRSALTLVAVIVFSMAFKDRLHASYVAFFNPGVVMTQQEADTTLGKLAEVLGTAEANAILASMGNIEATRDLYNGYVRFPWQKIYIDGGQTRLVEAFDELYQASVKDYAGCSSRGKKCVDPDDTLGVRLLEAYGQSGNAGTLLTAIVAWSVLDKVSPIKAERYRGELIELFTPMDFSGKPGVMLWLRAPVPAPVSQAPRT